MDKCHYDYHHQHDDVFEEQNETSSFGIEASVICDWQQPFIVERMTGNNNRTSAGDRCTVASLCAAEIAGYGIVVTTIAFVGVFLNTFNLIVLSTKRFPESSYTYLAGLAVADSLSLFFFAVNGIGRGFYPNHLAWRAFEVYVYFPCCTTTTTASILLTVTVTIERYAFIYHPLAAKTWCHQKTARKVVFVVWAVSVVINIPRFFVHAVGDQGELKFTSFGNSQSFAYLSWIYIFLLSLTTALILVVFNILLIIGVRRTNAKRRALCAGGGGDVSGAYGARQHREETTLTRTLIIVVCVFIAGELPSSFTSRSLFLALIGRSDKSLLLTTGYRVAVLISTILVVVQHSMNFVVYCVFNRRFCDVLRRHYIPVIFFCRCSSCRRRSRLTMVEDELLEKAERENTQNGSSLNAKTNSVI